MSKSKYQIELEDFKEKMIETVLACKDDYDLCEHDVKDFFARMGMEAPDIREFSTRRFDITIDFEVDVNACMSDLQNYIERLLHDVEDRVMEDHNVKPRSTVNVELIDHYWL